MPGQFNGLQDIQWAFLEPLLPPAPLKRKKGKSHTPWRKICNSLFWILITGSRWCDLPRCAIWGSRSVTHRWLGIWQENGT
ncbi:MAG: transposase [Chlamydia sp.]